MYVVCTAVFGLHVVCASARVWSLLRGLLSSQQEAEFSFWGFISTNKQTNKQTNHFGVGIDMYDIPHHLYHENKVSIAAACGISVVVEAIKAQMTRGRAAGRLLSAGKSRIQWS